jgi:hypothetical protein
MGQELLLPCQNVHCEAPRLQGGASRKGNFILIVPLDPAYPAETGRGTCRPNSYTLSRFLSRSPHPNKEIGIQKNKKTPFGLKVSVI